MPKFKDVFPGEIDGHRLHVPYGTTEEHMHDLLKMCMVAVYLSKNIVDAFERVINHFGGELLVNEVAMVMFTIGKLKADLEKRGIALTDVNHQELFRDEEDTQHHMIHTIAEQFGYGDEVDKKCRDNQVIKLKRLQEKLTNTSSSNLVDEAEKAIRELLKDRH